MQSNKNSNTDEKIYSLYKVVGIGSKDNFSISCNRINGITAWLTGPFVVFYDIKKDKQTKFLKNKNNKTFACLAFSADGNFLACGEGNCKNGEIIIYEVINDETSSGEIKRTIKSHKYGIEKLKYFKNDKYIISIGDAEDKNILITNTHTGETIFSSKYNRPIFSFDISDSFMILGGEKFLKLWNIDEVDNKKLVISKNNIDMGKLKEKVFFSSVIYTNDSTSEKKAFLITADGHLLEVKCATRQISRWMHLKTEKGLSLCLSEGNVICGCGDGIIRVFKADSFEHVMTLHRPPPLGKANIDSNIKKINISVSQDEKFADIIIVSQNNIHDKLISLYSDKTFFIWDIKKSEKIYVYRYNSFHSGSINNMDIQVNDDDVLKISTCSDDKTVKLWNFKLEDFGVQNPYFFNPRKIPHIAYSKILRKIFYFGKGFNQFKFDVESYIKGVVKVNNENNQNINNRNNISDESDDVEISTVKFSPDNQYLIFGDNVGNVYIYSLTNFEKINYASVHNAQITCIDIIKKDKLYLLVTGSMDNLITVFDISPGLHKDFENFERNVIEDHLGPVTNVLFCVDRLNNLKLVSCSADRSINFYLVETVSQIQLIQRFQEDDVNTYCLSFDPMNKHIIAGHNGKLTIWKSKIFTCQKIFQMKRGENFLDNFRIAVDKTGTIIAISNNDKYIRIRSTIDGHLFTKIPMAESISSLHFAINNNFLIASSVEGYIYFFKIDINSISLPILKGIEEKKKMKNKVKLLERFLKNDVSKNKPEKVRALIEKIQNSEEEFNFQDLNILTSYFEGIEKMNEDKNNPNSDEDIKFVNEIDINLKLKEQDDSHKNISKNINSAVIEIKEEKSNNENDEDNNNNKDLVKEISALQDNHIKNSFLTKSNLFEKNLKELPGEALKKSILNKSRISLTETYLKMKENKELHMPRGNIVESIFKKAEKLSEKDNRPPFNNVKIISNINNLNPIPNNIMNIPTPKAGEAIRVETRKISQEIPFVFNKESKPQSEILVDGEKENRKEISSKDDPTLAKKAEIIGNTYITNNIPQIHSKKSSQSEIKDPINLISQNNFSSQDINQVTVEKTVLTNNTIIEVNSVTSSSYNTTPNTTENFKLANEKDKEIEKDKEKEKEKENPAITCNYNSNNIITSNFFNKKFGPTANSPSPIDIKEKKLPIQRKQNPRDFSVSDSAINEIQQIISNTNKLVGDIHTKVYNTNENIKNKKEQIEDNYDYFTNEERLSLVGIKEFGDRNYQKAGNIFKRNLQEQSEAIARVELPPEEIKNKYNNILLEDDKKKEKNNLYEIAEELQFEDISEMNKEPTNNFEVSDTLMNKEKFLPDIIENTFLNSHINNQNAYVSQTDTFFNEFNTNTNINNDTNNLINKTSAVYNFDGNISDIGLKKIESNVTMNTNKNNRNLDLLNVIVKENNFQFNKDYEKFEFIIENFKHQIDSAESFIENLSDSDSDRLLDIKKLILKLNDKIDLKLNSRKDVRQENKYDDRNSIDDSLIEKYLEKYSALLVKKIEEKLNK